jgi:hypothetical protein
MAYNEDQREFPLPDGADNSRKSSQHLPRYFRTEVNNKFLSSTFDQFMQPGVAEKLNGFVGRKQAKAFQSQDFYIGDVSRERENYQLEPASVIKDNFGNVDFYADYNDYRNQIRNLDGAVDNDSVLSRQEFYAWNPHIDWDKFVNFREYYWLPNGPQSVPIAGESVDVETTYTVTSVDNIDNFAFVFTPDGLTQNPELTLYRGITYRFEIDSEGVPLSFRTNRVIAPEWRVRGFYTVGETVVFEGQIYTAEQDHRATDEFDFAKWNLNTSFNLTNEVSQQNVEDGVIELTLTPDTPDFIYYVSNRDINAGGLIRVYDIEEASFVDVEREIIGKKTYKSGNGIDLSNGMKIYFQGTTSPETFQTGFHYVDGVGDEIKLISEDDLTLSTDFVEDEIVEFDSEGFDTVPYSTAIGFPREKDYITINRSSQDGNLWSKYNRWFHREIIEKSAEINKTELVIDQSARATRPIIEFEPGIKLFNFGTESKKPVDLVDDFTIDVFSTIEGSEGYNIDGVDLTNGMRVLFTADADTRVNGKIYEVKFILFRGIRQIALVELEDSQPQENQTVLCGQGNTYKGKVLFFNGINWSLAQDKTSVNQSPKFDVFNCDGNSLSDKSVYPSTTFAGTEIFSYKLSSGPRDPELGFSLTYRNIENVGDLVFDFDLLTDAASFCPENSTPQEESTGLGFLRQYTTRTEFNVLNGWSKADVLSEQPVIRQFVVSSTQALYPIDVYDQSATLTDLSIKVYVNNRLQFENQDYELNSIPNGTAVVRFLRSLEIDDIVVLKTKSSQPKNQNGIYEIPAALERNPQNDDPREITLGEINDHVGTIIENLNSFTGEYPGVSNLRDQSNLAQYGRRIVKHSVPLNLPIYHVVDREANLVKSLKFARAEYGKFKRQVLQTAFDLPFDGPVKEHLDRILTEIVKDKPNTHPFYFSDMVPFGGARETVFEIDSEQQQFFALNSFFTLETLSSRAVLVYLNEQQLLHGEDYTFNSEGFIQITADIARGDTITVYEYESTNGCFCPPTPSKLGIYPLYQPQKFVDDTYLEPREVIQGHDGSIVFAFGDYRDELILELENRIYNNVKVAYNPDLFDINDHLSSAYYNTGIPREQLDSTMLSDFVQWRRLVDLDFTENNNFDRENGFTYNHSRMSDYVGNTLNGTWRAVYVHAFDTDRPHTHPWEVLGFAIKPSWWEEQYGPAPYTSNNLLLWEDLENGVIREPNKQPRVVERYRRPGLVSRLPVGENGELLSPVFSGYVRSYNSADLGNSWNYGDWSPVETAWRKSSEYPFALLTAILVNQPARTLATAWDRSRQFRSPIGEIVYNEPNRQLRLQDLEFPNTINDSERVFASGLVNYIKDYISSDITEVYSDYVNSVKSIENQIGFKLGGFTSKDKFNLILESRSPTNQGNVFVPDENYSIFLNTSSPTKTVFYSGVIIEKQTNGFAVRGYDEQTPYFTFYPVRESNRDREINVGGITENVIEWSEGQFLPKGLAVQFNNQFYRVAEGHTTGNSFDETKFASIPRLKTEGGRTAFLRYGFSLVSETIPYGTVFETIQDTIDFVLGYGHWLEEQGFVFDYYDAENGFVADWQTSVREFMFWTTQNWSEGSVLSLSPAAFRLRFRSDFAVVDDVYDTFYGYSIFKVDGKKLLPEYIRLSREESGLFEIQPKATADGIFGIRITTVQKEHAVIIDNRTEFGDVIYDQQAGYRQERIRVLGYRTTEWDGSVNIPGFVFDEARVTEWQPWQDYAIGEVVKHKEFYYSAKSKIPGSETFVPEQWARLSEQPQSELLPNWEYKTNQFADFYDLDTDNFDAEQQKFAQHLIGYQNRQYLANIVNDDVSQYKFYQGFIQDKGTQNALTKLFDALGSDDKDSLEFFEEWAIKTGQYGAAEGFEEVEYVLDEEQFKTSPQTIELVNQLPQNTNDLVYRIQPFDAYLTPRNYTHSIPIGKTQLDSFVKNAGYVNQQDVDLILDTYDDILEQTLENVNLGAKIWIGDEQQTWNVYSHVLTNYTIEKIENSDKGYALELSTVDFDVEIGEIIGIYNITDIEGFAKVYDIENNVIYIENSSANDIALDAPQPRISRLLSARFTDIAQVNNNSELFENGLDRIWVDSVDSSAWRVLDRKPVFETKQQISDADSKEFNYGSAIASNQSNTVLAVGSPDETDGKVYVYTRSVQTSDYRLAAILEAESDAADPQQRFGASVAVSEDGEYIAIGSPDASSVKSFYAGEYQETANYTQNEIVRYQDSLWQALVNIQGRVPSVEFGSFESVPQILIDLNLTEQDDEFIPVLFTGNYPFENVTTDHLIVKAPKDMYEGAGEGDEVQLEWNTLSYAYQNASSLSTTQPFDGNNSVITADFVSSTHIIQQKIDSILYVKNSTNIPDVGQIVETVAAFGEVAYTFNQGGEVTIYVKNQNGDFGLQGSLTTSIGEFVGEYVTQAPREQTLDADKYWGGFWYISTPESYNTGTDIADAGRGLVYRDVITDSTQSDRFYFNSLNYQSTDFASFDTRNSELNVLTYQGQPGPGGVVGAFESQLFFLRAPAELTGAVGSSSFVPLVSTGDEVEVFYNAMPNFETEDFKDPAAIGLTVSDINKKQTIFDIWDGYIDFEITKNLGGIPLEPRVGITVQDVTNLGTAEVVFYQRFDTNSGRIYVKNVSGTWALGNDFGENREIQFLSDGSGDSVYDPAIGFRVFGQIQSRSLGYEPAGIGKLLVFQKQESIRLETISQERILDAEYWFYLEDTVFGVSREPNIPAPTNNDWFQVYRIPAGAGGTNVGPDNEGFFSIYERTGTIQWTKIGSFILPDRVENSFLGFDLQFSTLDNLTKLFVKSKGNNTVDNPGKISIYKKGIDQGFDYSWEQGTNKNYKGVFANNQDYVEGSIVFVDGKLYQSQTNVVAGPFDTAEWIEVDFPVDYLGFIPNDTGNVLDEDSSNVLDQTNLIQFASDFDVNSNGEVLVVSSGYQGLPNKAVVYRNINGVYLKYDEIIEENSNSRFGESVSISNDGTFFAVGAPGDTVDYANEGKVYVYRQQNSQFSLSQEIVSSTVDVGEQFGIELECNNNTLAISAKNADTNIDTGFDSNSTTFDNKLTRFRSFYENTGTVKLYEKIGNSFVYAETIDLEVKGVAYFGSVLSLNQNHVYVGLPSLSLEDSSDKPTVVDYSKIQNTSTWQVLRTIKDTVDVNKIKQVFLYNTKTNQIVERLDYVDPLQGKITGIAEQELRYKLFYDPAVYTQGENVQVDETNSWGASQTGQLWWDLSNAKFLNPYQSSVIYSANAWNTLFSNRNTIDVYEWVESDILPAEWDRLSGTEEGFSRGITGVTRYGNTAYVEKRSYDKTSRTFTTKYYYWVRNKQTVPAVPDRKNSAQDIAQLIADPAGQGYRFAAFINPTEIALYNCDSLIQDKNVALSIQYWTIDNQTINVHNQYQIITEGSDTSVPNRDVEQKWFDSLVGFDSARRPVPAPELSEKEKYGILNTPRQSWFENRTQALKEVVDRINRTLSKNLIVESKNISRLTESEPAPSIETGLFDLVVESRLDLDFVGVARARQAQLTPVVENGKIIRVDIVDAGRGYRVAPTVSVSGMGENAVIETTINSQGSIDSVIILNQGEYYTENTALTVRRFTALVQNDETIEGRWALFERNTQTRTWTRIKSQGYNVNLYWRYKDWYKSGYGSFTDIDSIIDFTYELQSIDNNIGDVVKIENVGSGGWLLLEKINNQPDVDYTVNYETIGRENGTIELTENLYNIEQNLSGFDTTAFDSLNFDSIPSREIRIILETIRDEVFTGELAIEYNRLFFASLRYVFSEQNYVDWAFKTSFIKAQHNVGELRQKITFENDNLPNYEDYALEVKPYKSQIREYVSSYEKIDPSRSMITDFDLAPRFVSIDNKIQPYNVKLFDNAIVENQAIDSYPARHWSDNVGFEVVEIDIVDPGEGYTSAPVVTISGGGGSEATASASIGKNGAVVAVNLEQQGAGFLSAPKVTLNGSIRDGGKPARAVARIGNTKVRNLQTIIKFDRVSGTYEFVNLQTRESFVGSGNRTVFDLEWPMDLRTNKVSVVVNGTEALGGIYTYENILDTTKGYERYQGRLTFNDPPVKDAAIEITYFKAPELLNAQDRINQFYEPSETQSGKSLAQLMEGVDYGGVEINSFGFASSSGWDAQPWFSQSWDVFDTDFEDEIIQLDGSTIEIELSSPLESGVTYNLYRIARDSNGQIVSNTRLDDINFGTPQQTNENATITSIEGDGSTIILYLDELGVETTPQTAQEDTITVVIRKITSDGSFIPDPESYDTKLGGGDLAYSTATGLEPGDINVDGDGFVTTTTSKGPEEVVPGQVVDTLDIQVYERPVDGSSNIVSRNYHTDGETAVFNAGATIIKQENVFVKLNGILQDKSAYEIDYRNNDIVFNTLPTAGDFVNVITLGHSGSNILDIEEFQGDGSTTTFLTNVRWQADLSVFATINGKVADFDTFESDESYDYPNNLVVKFATPPDIADQISILVGIDGIQYDQFSQVTIDEFVADGSTTEFELGSNIFEQQPAYAYTLVQVNNRFLNAGYSQVFEVSQSREYQLDLAQIPVGSVNAFEIEVYLNGVKIEYIQEWTFQGAGAFDPNAGLQAGSTLVLQPGVGNTGDELKVFVLTDGDYRFGYFDSDNTFIEERGEDSTTPVLHLDEAPQAGDVIKVYNFSNHNSQGIERQSFDVIEKTVLTPGTAQFIGFQQLRNGVIELRKPARDAEFVWVLKNKNLLTPSVDYYVTEDRMHVKLVETPGEADEIEIVHFANSPVTSRFGWRQFKDMLNKTHYKKLTETYTLAQDLNYDDSVIYVTDAVDLPAPKFNSDKPGVLFIQGERIEYFIKDGNTLKQLRRGTLGTGVKTVYPAGTEFREQGESADIPYEDKTDIVSVVCGGYDKGLVDYGNSPGVSVDSVSYDFNNNTAFPLGGQIATVKGTGFKENAVVFVGEVECDTTFVSDTEVTFITPALPVGAYDLIVVNPFTTTPITTPQSSAVLSDGVVYVQILLPYAPLPETDTVTNPAETGDWYTESQEDQGIPDDYWQALDIEVFEAGRRLRKNSVSVYDYEAQDSPEGDEQVQAEFAVNKNIGSYVRLTNPPPKDVVINVVRKTGTIWNEPGVPLAQSNTAISEFLRSGSTRLPR